MQLLFAMASSFKYVYINAHMPVYVLWNYKKKEREREESDSCYVPKKMNKIPGNNLFVCVLLLFVCVFFKQWMQ